MREYEHFLINRDDDGNVTGLTPVDAQRTDDGTYEVIRHKPWCQINQEPPAGFPWGTFTCNCDVDA